MRSYLLMAPTWVRSLVYGLFFGVATLFTGTHHDSWPFRVIGATLAGLFYGVVMGQFGKKRFAAARAELTALTRDQRRSAIRAVARGPVPADTAVRLTALHIAERDGTLVRQWYRPNLVVMAAMIPSCAALALLVSPWWWAAVPVAAAGLVSVAIAPRRSERRIRTLSGGHPEREALPR